MRTIKIEATREPIAYTKNRYEREEHYRNRINSKKEFNLLVEKLNGKEISITRINQALEVYRYAGANYLGNPPKFYAAVLVENTDEKDVFFLTLETCYKSVDEWVVCQQ